MTEANAGDECIISIFDTMSETERALNSLTASRFPLEQISFASRNLHSDAQRHGFASTSRHTEESPWYGGLFGVLIGVAFVVLPGFGLLIVAGPLAAKVKNHLVSEASADVLLASLTEWGVRADQVARYSASLRQDKHLLVLHGSAEQLVNAPGFEGGSSANGHSP